jgi:hypothetical protein
MELDNLRYVWKRLGEEEAAREKEGLILDLIAKNSAGPLSRMKRNLLIEFVLAVLLYVPLKNTFVFI